MLSRMTPALAHVLAGIVLAAPPVVDDARAPIVEARPVADDSVVWEAPRECPDDAAIEARIAELVGEPPVPTPATAKVQRLADRWQVELVTWIDGGSQRRELSASDCAVLADVVAVVIAVALDPVVAAERSPAAPPNQETVLERDETRTPTRSDRAPPIERTRRSQPRARLSPGIELGAGYGSGAAPTGSAVLHTAVLLGRRSWDVGLDVRMWLPRTVSRGEPTVEARLLLGTVGVLGCGKGNLRRRVEIPVCLGVEAGGLQARGITGLAGPSTKTFPWVAPRLRVGLRVGLGRGVGLWFAAEGAAPLVRTFVDVGGATPFRLWSNPPVSIRVMLGLDVRWRR